jgi:excisionase family DNA binding protein
MVVYMQISVAEAAARLGVTPRAVQKAIQSGGLSASRVGRIWLLDEQEIAVPRPSSRPMSQRVAWAFLDLLDGGPASAVAPSERSRLRVKRKQLLIESDPAALLRALLPKRSERMQLRVAEADLEELRVDPRLVLSGISDPRSRMSASSQVEGYVRQDVARDLQLDFRMSSRGAPNVVIRSVPAAVLPVRASLPMVAADLADWGGPREAAAAAALIHRLS